MWMVLSDDVETFCGFPGGEVANTDTLTALELGGVVGMMFEQLIHELLVAWFQTNDLVFGNSLYGTQNHLNGVDQGLLVLEGSGGQGHTALVLGRQVLITINIVGMNTYWAIRPIFDRHSIDAKAWVRWWSWCSA